MPLYDFKCRKCGHRFEELVRVSDSADCPKCKAKNAERQFSMSASVSTDKTRSRTAKIARRIATGVHKEKKAADAAYERNYIKEHSNTD
jgi:putative FmdB family regulatory protein